MKKLLVVVFVLLCLTVQPDSFIVTQDVSKNELKENIGEELKQALYTCTSIAGELGSVQKELATLQRQLLSRVEGLVDNKRPFKKASRDELKGASAVMAKLRAQLQEQEKSIKGMLVAMNDNKCLKGDG